jgi:hypothetical protein
LQKPRSRKTADLKYNRQLNYFAAGLKQSLLNKQRSSSSQDLVFSSEAEDQMKFEKPKTKFRRYSTSTGVLDFQKRGLVPDSSFSGKNTTSDVHLEHTPSPFDKTKDAEDDEGQMQCVFQFDLTRYE